MEIEIIKKSMMRHIMSINTAQTREHLKKLSYIELLNNCHPLHREGYAKLLMREGEITESQYKTYSRESL